MAYQDPTGETLRQADLLKDVSTFVLRRIEGGIPHGDLRTYKYALVLTQDCDLEQDFNARFPSENSSASMDKLLFGIVLCGAYPEDQLRSGLHRDGAMRFDKKRWKILTQNLEPRYQYLGYVPQADLHLIVDFKDYFLVPCDYLYAQIKEGLTRRVASMCAPYRQHVQQRFACYLMRIGLPVEFHGLPSPTQC